MKVIVHTVTEGMLGAVEVQHDNRLWIEKGDHGGLRITTFEDDVEVDVAVFAPGVWRAAVIAYEQPTSGDPLPF